MPSDGPLLLVLDGNSLLHRAYHAGSDEGWTDGLGRPMWALRGLVGYVARAAAHLRPHALIVGFDCPDFSARRDDYPGYKAQRADKPADLTEQLAGAPELLRAAGICTVVPRALEADDVLASAAELARRSGWRCVLMTSDRDAFALIDETTSVLRIRNGGFDRAVLVDAAGLREVYLVEPAQYHDYAALRGDPSDNLDGARQCGAARAARLLAEFGTVDGLWAALDSGAGPVVRQIVGDVAAEQLFLPATREIVERNRRIMRMRADLELPELDTARLPIDYALMRRALRARDINFGPSLWALTGRLPPVREEPREGPREEPRPFELRPWKFRRGMSSRREPTPGQLALF